MNNPAGEKKIRCLMASFGSRGDLVPVLWAGQQMAQQGHSVTVMASPVYQADVEEWGFKFLPIGTREEFIAQHSDPGLWDGTKTDKMTLSYTGNSLKYFEEQMKPLKGQYDVLMHNPLALGATVMAEKHGVPCITLHPHPFSFWLSARDMPLQRGMPKFIKKLPAWIAKPILSVVGPLATRGFKKILNDFRVKQGLKPVKSFYKEAWLGNRPHAGLFPQWFAPHQTDWPQNFEHFGFPLMTSSESLGGPVGNFIIESGKRSIVVWTAGAANLAANDFVAKAKVVTKQMGIRSIIVDASAETPRVEGDVLMIKSVPLQPVLSRSHAVVHHGGIGTAANALNEGVPQLIFPGMGDQFDNAYRMEKLGVAADLPAKKRSVENIKKSLSEILGSKPMSAASGTYKTVMRIETQRIGFAEWAQHQLRGQEMV